MNETISAEKEQIIKLFGPPVSIPGICISLSGNARGLEVEMLASQIIRLKLCLPRIILIKALPKVRGIKERA